MNTVILKLLIIALQYESIIAICTLTQDGYEIVSECVDLMDFRDIGRTYDSDNSYNAYGQRYKYSFLIKNSSLPVLFSNPQDNWYRMKALHLQNTKTTKILPGFLNAFRNLEVLSITDNKITIMDTGIFSALTQLKTLNLSRNLISSLKYGCLDGLTYLEYIDISDNLISVLPEHIFQYQMALSHVDVSRNTLEKIEAAFDQVNMTSIILSDNKLKEFNFKRIVSGRVEEINLSGNQLESIEMNNSQALIIENLDLARNKLKTLPEKLNVSVCNVSFNAIQSFDAVFTNKLEILDISHNNVTSFNVENVLNLRTLNISHNHISTIPINAFAKSLNLNYLDLSYNAINHLTFGHLNHLSNLRSLDISNNNMTFDFQILTTLITLEELHTYNNNIENFDAEIIYKLPNLKRVSLNDNIVNCGVLSSIVNKLQYKGVDIVRGQNVNGTNLMGVSCEHNKNLKEEIVLINRDQMSSQEDRFAVLLKHLETIANNLSNNKPSKAISGGDKLINFLNENFTSTNFFKFITARNFSNVQENAARSNGAFQDFFNFFNKNNRSFSNSIENMNKLPRFFNTTINEIKKESGLIVNELQSIRNLSYILANLRLNNPNPSGVAQSSALISDFSPRSSNSSEKQVVFLNAILVLMFFSVIILYIYEKFVYKRKNQGADSLDRVELVTSNSL